MQPQNLQILSQLSPKANALCYEFRTASETLSRTYVIVSHTVFFLDWDAPSILSDSRVTRSKSFEIDTRLYSCKAHAQLPFNLRAYNNVTIQNYLKIRIVPPRDMGTEHDVYAGMC